MALIPSPQRRRQLITPEVRVVALSVVLAGLAVWGDVALLREIEMPGAGLTIPWWALAGLFTFTEVFVIHVQFRREAHTFSLSELPLVVGLFFVRPELLLLARLVGSAPALVLHRRQYGVKLLFNLSMFASEVVLASIVADAVRGGATAIDPRAWAATFLAMFAATVLSTTSVSLAISLHEGRLELRRIGQIFATGVLMSAVTNTSLGLMAVVVLTAEPRAIWLLGAVVTILFVAYQGYTSLRQRYSSLELLYEFTRAVGRSLQLEPMAGEILSQAVRLLRAERGEMIILDRTGQPMAALALAAGGELERAHPSLATARPLIAAVIASGEPALLPRTVRDEHSRRLLSYDGAKDAMAVPLPGEHGVIGALVVSNRLGDVSTFDADDMKLFQTLANHAAVSMENGRLLEKLRDEAAEKEHQALHDSLTGLPNRTSFQRQIDDAIRTCPPDRPGVAVMLIDLDRFKEVNDTLGHQNGDLVLGEIGTRLRLALRGWPSVLARLGGDEFGVLLPELGGPQDASDVADRVLAALHEAVRLDDLALEIGASIGIAMHPQHGNDSTTLLQRADVAMYAAKGARTGYEVYREDADQYSPRRLTLINQLRGALEREELKVHYQPKVDLATGDAIGAEALVRWIHPEHGFVPPDEFIPIAEQTGLIRPLTRYVLRKSLGQVAEWRRDGMELKVAVNLSARSLLDLELPRDVSRLLRETGVPASMLTLEITESSMLADPTRTVGVLSRLSTLGVTLSIDDFGTGYSSLSYLKRLPVDEVKIDRSFVMGMATEEGDAVIVRSTIDLGHNLGMRVVAEGVEDQHTMDRLRDLHCDEAQGYHLGRPMPAEALTEWYRERIAAEEAADVALDLAPEDDEGEGGGDIVRFPVTGR